MSLLEDRDKRRLTEDGVTGGLGSTGLELVDVTAGYGSVDVLHGVSLAAPAGELTGLIGPNGSGKTTVVRVLSRALRPRSGRVLVHGKDPYRMRARQAARLVAVVPQEVSPVFSYSVREMTLLGRSPYLSPWGSGSEVDWHKAREAMALAGVSDLAERAVEDLSGGERQRVLLAQAIAQDAPAVVLDEPTTHLDLRHVVRTLTALRSMAKQQGKAVLAIFHDVNLASGYCDRIYAMDAGRVAAVGPPEVVIEPSLLRRLFDVDVEVTEHPRTGLPAVLPPGPGAPPPGLIS